MCSSITHLSRGSIFLFKFVKPRRRDVSPCETLKKRSFEHHLTSRQRVDSIREVDFAIQTLYSNLTERQKKFSKYAEQIQKVGEVKTCLKKIRMNIDQTLPLMEKLNSVLHPGDQLEHFQVKQQK
ncbi:hypothetical protein CAPTEDRAFT_216779 [Capitella teleta]|uniref:BLOC-1-related complex subunit 5 n=1 Tax=Capitella teleta TaxID=283909 RepID=R7V6I3_CAPTE|nr:hypothetical protein CAPTEDRAFT_216779 [Capitella teleta]|eukprot:ELU11971.1 hypothetical protein CAPTEDRAFT_216779 [Capitella teleta]